MDKYHIQINIHPVEDDVILTTKTHFLLLTQGEGIDRETALETVKRIKVELEDLAGLAKSIESNWREIPLCIKTEKYKNLLDDKTVRFCYILKSGQYFRPNAKGYTKSQALAGVFKKDDAVERARSCSDLRLIPVDIDEHNHVVFSEIKRVRKNQIIG